MTYLNCVIVYILIYFHSVVLILSYHLPSDYVLYVFQFLSQFYSISVSYSRLCIIEDSSSSIFTLLRASCSKHRLELTTRLTRGISPVNSWGVVTRQNPRVKPRARLTRELKLTSG